MTERLKNIKFEKCYTQLWYIFDSEEMRFITNIRSVQHISSLGYNTDWSKDFMMNRVDMSRSIFNRCEKKLIEMKLLERRSVGKKVCYNWNNDLFESLVLIASVTNNVFALKEFCKRKFITEKKGIADITEEEIKFLKNAERSNRRY